MTGNTSAILEPSCNVAKAEVIDFWLGRLVYCIIVMLGLLGNFLTILVFSQECMTNIFNRLLMFLAYFDISYLFFCLTDAVITVTDRILTGIHPDPPDRVNGLSAMLDPYLLHPMIQTFQTAVTYMTIAISCNRYVAIVHPLLSVRLFTPITDQKKLRFRFCGAHLTAAVIFVCSFLFCLPHFFEYTYVIHPNAIFTLEVTDFRSREAYSEIYTGYLDTLVRSVVPVVVMIYTNVRVFLVLRSESQIRHQEKAFAVTAVVLFTIFLMCNTCKIFYNVYMFVVTTANEQDPCWEEETWLVVVYSLGRVFLVVNSSINCLVYLTTGAKFREVFLETFCFKKRRFRKADSVHVRLTPSMSWTRTATLQTRP